MSTFFSSHILFNLPSHSPILCHNIFHVLDLQFFSNFLTHMCCPFFKTNVGCLSVCNVCRLSSSTVPRVMFCRLGWKVGQSMNKHFKRSKMLSDFWVSPLGGLRGGFTSSQSHAGMTKSEQVGLECPEDLPYWPVMRSGDSFSLAPFIDHFTSWNALHPPWLPSLFSLRSDIHERFQVQIFPLHSLDVIERGIVWMFAV